MASRIRTTATANRLPDSCEPGAVDGDGDGVPDCVERAAACGNCRDDDGDGALDLADSTCASIPAALGRARASAGRRAGRLSVKLVVPAPLVGLDANPPLFTLTFGDRTIFCGQVRLARRGGRFRLRGRNGALGKLVLDPRRRAGASRLRATLRIPVPLPPAGALLGLSLQAGDGAYYAGGALRARGRRLVFP